MDEFERQSDATDVHARERAQDLSAIETALNQAARDFAAYASQRNLATTAFPNDSRRGWVIGLHGRYDGSNIASLAILEDGDWANYGYVELKRSWLWTTLVHRDFANGIDGKDIARLNFYGPKDVHEELAIGLQGHVNRQGG